MNADAQTPQPWPTLSADQHEAIRQRAEEIYIRNGRIPGRDMENWAQSEQEILCESPEPTTRKAIGVKVDDAQDIGPFAPESSDGYVPAEFGPDASVPVRFQGYKMFIKPSNGKIQETTNVKKIG